MSIERIIAAAFVLLVGSAVLAVVLLRRPKKLKATYFSNSWKELQGYCKDRATWPQALEVADQLLDKALRKRKFKGRSMGERMVSAQRTFTDNDTAWFAHNLHKKIIADPNLKLKETDVKDALVGFRQALRDLGALPSGSPEVKPKS